MEDFMKYISDVTTLEFNPDKCTGCGICTEVCPHSVFAINGKKARITDRDLCMECGACATNCAFGAIKVNNGVGCASALINSMITGGEPTCGCSSNDTKSGCC